MWLAKAWIFDLRLKAKFVRLNQLNFTSCTILKNRQDVCSTKSEFSCGVGILPARKKPIENGAISPLNPLNPVHSSLPNFVLQVSREIYLKSTSTTAGTIAKRSISAHPELGWLPDFQPNARRRIASPKNCLRARKALPK